MRTAVKNAKTAINNNADNKAELVNFAIKSVDKAQSNLIHSNKADRIKSQLMSSSNNLLKSAEQCSVLFMLDKFPYNINYVFITDLI